ncbi:hypothetical protein TrCOL_g319 [Triparma columacea]|uniref:Protein SYS1 homolog n=1 Tax=Triparma columacea TaxID=722753 RepID=A0A9W7LCN4_9STRA|nr:hypothetical protein TrCOL_g319 [Triparma columacea]
MKKGKGAMFSPKLILAQIVALQCYHYFTLCLIYQVISIFSSTSPTLVNILGTERLSFGSVQGIMDCLVLITGYVANTVGLYLVVKKSAKCLDFTITLLIFHLLSTILYTRGFPTSWEWWIINVVGGLVMVLGGEWVCSRAELRDIPSLLG